MIIIIILLINLEIINPILFYMLLITRQKIIIVTWDIACVQIVGFVDFY